MTPKLRFKGFTDDWEQRKLGDIFKYEQPQQYIVSSTKYDDKYDIPVLTAGQSFILGYTNETNGIKMASKEAPIIIFDDFTTSSHYVDFPFKVKSSAMKLLSLNDRKDNIHCAFNVLQNIDYTPVSHERHWISTFANFNVLLPSSPKEQRQIGEFFAQMDDLITLHQRECDTLERIKKGFMQKIFSQEIRFKADDGSEFPDWEEKRLGKIGSLLNGYPFNNSDYVDGGRYNIITIGNVTGDKYIHLTDKNNKIDRIPENISEHQKLKKNDILISLTGNVGRVSLNTAENNLLNQRVGLLRVHNNYCYPEFVYYTIANQTFTSLMISKGKGVAQLNISKCDVEDFKIPIPCFEEQQKIADFLSSMDEKNSVAQKELEFLKIIKKGFLQQMFVQPR